MRGLRLKFTKDNPLTLSRRFEDALAYATVIHAGQLRKGGQYGVSQQILTDSARDNLDIFWLKDTLEDSANLAGLSSLPGFPRHTRSLGASRRKVAAAFLRAANANPDIIAAE
jgi:hypothetical protein